MGERRRTPVAAQRALLLGGGLLAALLIGEGAARSVQTSLDVDNFNLAGGGNRAGCVRPSATRGYEPVPGACGVDGNGARAYGAEAGTRVLVVGDSISTQTTWPAALAEALSAGWGAAPVRLNTLGVPGYNTCQELSMVREKVALYEPDLVLLQSCANDARGSPVLTTINGRAHYYMRDEGVEFPAWMLHSRLLTLLELGFGPRFPVDALASGPERTAECLAALVEEVAGRGVPLLTTLFPLFWEVAEAPAPMFADEAEMRSLLLESGLPFLDLRPVYEAAGPMVEHRDSATDFIHPSAAGQRIAAAAIAKWTLTEVPRPPLEPER